MSNSQAELSMRLTELNATETAAESLVWLDDQELVRVSDIRRIRIDHNRIVSILVGQDWRVMHPRRSAVLLTLLPLPRDPAS